MSIPKLVILSKPECCLCIQAKDIAQRLRKRFRFDLQVVDVNSDEGLRARYQYEVPVVFLDGRKIFKFQVTERELAEKLERAQTA